MTSETTSRRDYLPWAAVLLITAAAMFGGGSRENALRLGVVEIAALPVLFLALRERLRAGPEPGLGLPHLVLALIVAIPLIQLIPLPPTVWPTLPGQAQRLEALHLAGLTPGWRSLTLAPRDTQNAVLALVPPVAMFLAATRLDRTARDRAALVWIAVTAVGLGLGLVQLAGSPGVAAYPYTTTNPGSLVGWFANRNHEAGCLLATLPFATVFPRRGPVARPAWRFGAAALLCTAAFGAVILVRSRAGVLLGLPVVGACMILAWSDLQAHGRRRTVFFGLAILASAAALVALFALTPALDRLTGARPAEFRLEAWPIIARAARDHLPFGAGIGAFDRVYRAVEPLRLLVANYFNHAHNDYLETVLEAGWAGVVAIGAFAAWAAGAVGRAAAGGDSLARAAAIAVAVLLAQSFVDYPLRTEALAVWIAFCCGVLATPDRGRAVASSAR